MCRKSLPNLTQHVVYFTFKWFKEVIKLPRSFKDHYSLSRDVPILLIEFLWRWSQMYRSAIDWNTFSTPKNEVAITVEASSACNGLLAAWMCWKIAFCHFYVTDTWLSLMEQIIFSYINHSINKSATVVNLSLSPLCWRKVWMMGNKDASSAFLMKLRTSLW